MEMYCVRSGVLAVIAMAACTHARETTAPTVAVRAKSAPPAKITRLVVLPAESMAFPRAAKATTESLVNAHVDGLGVAQVSKVSLEVVQLSIECVDASAECYEAVGRSLTAHGLLFAQIAQLKKRQLKVTVTLFAVDAKSPRTKAEKVFASEDEATAGIADLVAEVTRR